jgi:hypothetical protein
MSVKSSLELMFIVFICLVQTKEEQTRQWSKGKGQTQSTKHNTENIHSTSKQISARNNKSNF